MTPRWPTKAALLLALAPGCTYISQGLFEEERGSLDEDGDGIPWDQDCDDQDDLRAPGLPETPYDGRDNDCGRDGDVVDQDGDGFPGILAEDYEALDPDETFPEELVGRPLDCADDPNARADAASIYPGANEVAYDGIDADCDLGNDFDVDGDGWMPAAAVVGGESVDVAGAFPEYVQTWGYEGQLALWAPDGADEPAIGDCDDFDADVNPAPTRADDHYDGVDTDCLGDNDFDADGDGWMPAELPGGGDIQAAFTQFVAFYYDGVDPFPVPEEITLEDGRELDRFSDCLDTAKKAIAADPADIYPRPDLAGDAWYDGIDTNCWADNDFDQDVDAYMPDLVGPIVVSSAYAAYVADWGYEGRVSAWGAPNLPEPGLGDCEDADPDTYPAALERLGDGVDQDCDGLTDAASFTFGDFEWDQPSAPEVVRVGDTYVFGLTARWMQVGFGTIWEEVGVTLAVQKSVASSGVIPVAGYFKLPNAANPIADVIDVAVAPALSDLSETPDGVLDPYAWFGTHYTATSNGYTYVYAKRVYEDSGTGDIVAETSNIGNWDVDGYVPSSNELVVDAVGDPFVFGCTTDLLHAVQGTENQPTDPNLLDGTGNGDLCFANGDPYDDPPFQSVDFTRCTAIGCQAYTLQRSSGLSVVAGAPTGEQWDEADYHAGLQVLIGTGPGATVRNPATGFDMDVFTTDTVLSADAMIDGSVLYVAAVVDRSPNPPVVQLRYGTFPFLQTIDFPFLHPDFPDALPAEVGLHADQDRVVVVVVGEDPGGSYSDAVGWAIVGP